MKAEVLSMVENSAGRDDFKWLESQVIQTYAMTQLSQRIHDFKCQLEVLQEPQFNTPDTLASRHYATLVDIVTKW